MGYFAKNNGATRYRGRIVTYKKGYNEIKKGVLDHVGSCEWTESTSAGKSKTTVIKKGEATTRKAPTSDSTVDEIKAYLDAEGIEYDSKAKKAELLDLID